MRQPSSKTYSTDDCAEESESFVTGTAVFSKYQKQAYIRLETWRKKGMILEKTRTAIVNKHQLINHYLQATSLTSWQKQ